LSPCLRRAECSQLKRRNSRTPQIFPKSTLSVIGVAGPLLQGNERSLTLMPARLFGAGPTFSVPLGRLSRQPPTRVFLRASFFTGRATLSVVRISLLHLSPASTLARASFSCQPPTSTLARASFSCQPPTSALARASFSRQPPAST